MNKPLISLSVVSHGHGNLVAALLSDLAQPDWHGGHAFEVIVTLNIAEDETWLDRPFAFPVKVLRNDAPKGFGANHNSAFKTAVGSVFVVVNPDIRLADFRVADLLNEIAKPKVGVCGPIVRSPSGQVEDSARRYPTFFGIVRRRLRQAHGPDYTPVEQAQSVDWLAGMFLMFAMPAYAAVDGFDERYFMYLEDVEICLTLRRRGYDVRWVGTTTVVHDAARASRSSRRHLAWHMQSLARFLLGRARA